jgi:NAD(P)-dependent dehydrogenase (short-subunit alcohol dehydrogenase family)
MINASVETFGRIDILVNNAGIVTRKLFLEHTEEDWDRVMNTNAKGVFLCSRDAARVMKAQGKGKIVNIGSTFGQIGTRRGAYGPSKAAVLNLTAAMALELAPYRINVNAVSPGRIRTPMSAGLKASKEELERILGCIPLGRLGEPADVACAVTYLASDQSDYLVGSVIVVDGGMTTTFGVF